MKWRDSQGGSLTDLAVHNRLLVLNIVRRHSPLSKPRIAEMTGLTEGTVANIIRELESGQWIRKDGLGASRGGRRPALYRMDSGGRRVIAVDLSGYDVEVALVDLAGQILKKAKRVVDLERNTPVLEIIQGISSLLEKFEPGELLGIGVSVPGIVDPEDGTVLNSVPLRWKDVPLQTVLGQTFPCPVVVGNQTYAALEGERSFSPGGDLGDFVYLAVSTGVGLGVVVNSGLIRGHHGISGELGHSIADPDGPPCECGNRGCLEQVASSKAFRKYVHQSGVWRNGSGGTEAELVELFRAACEGHPAVEDALRRVVGYLGVALVNLVRIFDPARIIFSGPAEDRDRILFRRLVEEFGKYQPLIDNQTVNLEASTLARDARLLGCSVWLVEEVFQQRSVVSHSDVG